MMLLLTVSTQDQLFIQTTSIIQNISELDQETLASVAVPAIKGLSGFLFKCNPLQVKVIALLEFWSILQRLHYHDQVAIMILKILEKVITSSRFIVTADNYMSVISLANDFSRAASVTYLTKQEEATHTMYLQATEPPNLRCVLSFRTVSEH
jgi:brefeldin A-resistance guanine nucleotide exchange factor 1